MIANAIRMIASAGGAFLTIYVFDLGITGFFATVASGFCLYPARAVARVRPPAAECIAPL
jgi:hypothetical protein